jgi:hypothetical protein
MSRTDPTQEKEPTEQVVFPQINTFPAIPRPYQLRDWSAVARKYDEFLFQDNDADRCLPFVWEDDRELNYDQQSFGLPSYVCEEQELGKRDEAITCLAAVVSASLNGIDKRKAPRGKNWVKMCKNWFNRENNAGVYLNNKSSTGKGSLWYAGMAQVLSFQLMDLYPDVSGFDSQLRESARTIHNMCRTLGDGDVSNPDFRIQGFDFANMEPTPGNRYEAEGAASSGWLLYMAHQRLGEAKYLNAAKGCLNFLDTQSNNPFYEVLLPYGAITAARMNAEEDTAYDVKQLLEWTFGPSDARPGWGIVNERWGEYDCHGLQGSLTNRWGYAFAMNTFQTVSIAAPVPRYDQRFARLLGKWVLNAANNARLFYPSSLSAEQCDQASREWSESHDPEGVVAFEGLKHVTPKGDAPYGTGDAADGDPPPLNLATYGSSHVGFLGAIVSETNVEAVVEVDLRATDFYQKDAYPTYLYYNPHSQPKELKVNTASNTAVDLYETTSHSFVANDVEGETQITLPASTALVIVEVPNQAEYETEGGNLYADNTPVEYRY